MVKHQRLHAFITGRVQGVSFRWYTQQKANALRLMGYAHNLADRRVEVLAEGEREQLELLLEWLRTGPPAARVDNVNFVWSDADDSFNRFEIG